MKLPDLVARYQRHYEANEAVKRGRYTASKYRVRCATNYLLETIIRGDALNDHGLAPTRSATPPEELPQLNLLAEDLPGEGGEPVRALADLDVEDLTRHDIRAYLQHLLTKRNRDGQPWALDSVNKYRQAVLKMVEWAEDEGVLSAEVHYELKRCKPIKAGKTVARRSKRVKPASEDVLFALVEHLRAKAEAMPINTAAKRRKRRQVMLWAIAVEITWESGMRPIETVLMRPVDVRPSPLDPGVFEYEPDESKTEHLDGEPRVVGFTERAKALFDEAVALWTNDGHQGQLNFAVDYDPEARLFPWRAAHPYDARGGFTRRVVAELNTAGLPKMTTRQIRHAFLTRAAAIDVRLAQVGGGHKHYSTTENYVHGDDAARLELIAHLNRNAGHPPNPPTNPPSPAAVAAAHRREDDEPFELRLAL
ncbi:MAG: hypothetical protein AAGJ38_05020 [Planctomycetota bacterium]